MSWPIIIIFLLIGLALIALEIVALPGAVSGICGGIIVIIGIWQTYANYGSTAGNITLISSVVIGVAMLAILLKSGTWKRFSLNDESDSKVNQVGTTIQVGAHGVTVSRLAPAGKAMFGSELVEVHSEGMFIDEHRPVEVISVEGYLVTVKEIPQQLS